MFDQSIPISDGAIACCLINGQCRDDRGDEADADCSSDDSESDAEIGIETASAAARGVSPARDDDHRQSSNDHRQPSARFGHHGQRQQDQARSHPGASSDGNSLPSQAAANGVSRSRSGAARGSRASRTPRHPITQPSPVASSVGSSLASSPSHPASTTGGNATGCRSGALTPVSNSPVAVAEATASAAAAVAYADRILGLSGKEQRRTAEPPRRGSQSTATGGVPQADTALQLPVAQPPMAWRQPLHHPHLRHPPRAFSDEPPYMQQVRHQLPETSTTSALPYVLLHAAQGRVDCFTCTAVSSF